MRKKWQPLGRRLFPKGIKKLRLDSTSISLRNVVHPRVSTMIYSYVSRVDFRYFKDKTGSLAGRVPRIDSKLWSSDKHREERGHIYGNIQQRLDSIHHRAYRQRTFVEQLEINTFLSTTVNGTIDVQIVAGVCGKSSERTQINRGAAPRRKQRVSWSFNVRSRLNPIEVAGSRQLYDISLRASNIYELLPSPAEKTTVVKRALFY